MDWTINDIMSEVAKVIGGGTGASAAAIAVVGSINVMP